jgi:hypothetical protein
MGARARCFKRYDEFLNVKLHDLLPFREIDEELDWERAFRRFDLLI